MGDESYKFDWCDRHQVLFMSSLPLTAKCRLADSAVVRKGDARRRVASDARS